MTTLEIHRVIKIAKELKFIAAMKSWNRDLELDYNDTIRLLYEEQAKLEKEELLSHSKN